MKKLVEILFVVLCLSAFGSAARGQEVDPSWQILWPTCSAGQAYSPNTNACESVVLAAPSGAQTITQPSSSQPLSVNYESVEILNSVPRADQFPGSDLCVKLRAAEVYALANNIKIVDATGFTGATQSSSVDPFKALATAGTTTPLTVYLPATTIQFSFVDGLSNGITVNTSGITLVGQGRFATIFQYTGTSAANYAFGTGALNNINGAFQLFRDFSVLGNSHTVNALTLQNWHRSKIENVSAWGATGCGVYTAGAVSDTFNDIRVSSFDAALANPVWTGLQTPTCGVGLDAFGGNATTAGTFEDLAVEGINGIGLKLLSADSMTFTSGTSESNVQGIVVSSGSKWNSVIGMDIESNTLGTAGVDVTDNGQSNFYMNVIMASASSGVSAVFGGSGGQYILGEGAIAHLWSGTVNIVGVGTDFSANGASTTKVAQLNSLGNAQASSIQVRNNIVNAVGLQTVTASGCAITAGAIGNNCNNTITLPVTEPDTAYNVTCNIRAAAAGINGTGNITISSTTQFIVPSVALTTTGTGGGFLDCTITHR
jgi:hypothetical protein